MRLCLHFIALIAVLNKKMLEIVSYCYGDIEKQNTHLYTNQTEM